MASKTKPRKAPAKKRAPAKRALKRATTKAKKAVKRAAKALKTAARKVTRDGQRHMPPKRLEHAAPAEIAERLAAIAPQLELAHRNPFELLIATMLAAQSTDRTVNQVMPNLLARFPDAHALAASEQSEVEQLVLRTGFFRNKAKAIRGAAQALVNAHDGEVPRTMEQLVALPGVARKTANVVLGTAYGISAGFIVDTHVMRVAQRLALTRQTDPVRIEEDLCAAFPREQWVDLAHRFTLHGRYTCLAKEPQCEVCPLNELCPSRLDEPVQPWPQRAHEEAARTHAGVQASRGY